MAYREVTRVEIPDIIRRWQAGDRQRKIALGTGLSRDTIAKYITAAQGASIAQGGPAATEEQLSVLATIGQVGPRQVETPRQDLLERWTDQIFQWLTGDRMTPAACLSSEYLCAIRDRVNPCGTDARVCVNAHRD